ncbi:helix-turn-helix transcriptional regulator [Clostridium sp. ZS2]|uniref:helix-turn-helix domain-containing protein n=1 Tax=Clostridium sp. ZS2 TaxID=2949988 RepID=UPI002079DAB6|nr:helix-turn-helix transcriptional regulator [Clostridium sp. ZS2]
MNERIKQIRKEKKLSQAEFGKNINLSQNHISSIEKGVRSITDRIINDICKIYNVNENWLRTGEGNIYRDPFDSLVIDDPEIKEFLISFKQIDESMQQTIKEMVRKIAKK